MLSAKRLSSLTASEDFNTTYALLTPEYRDLISYDEYVESVKDIPFDKDKVINMQPYLKDYTKAHGLVETWNDMLKTELK